MIKYIYKDTVATSLLRTNREIILMLAQSSGRDKFQTGDLLFLAANAGSYAVHAGLYASESRSVHAPAAVDMVKLDSLNKAYRKKTYLNAKRVLLTEQHLAHNP